MDVKICGCAKGALCKEMKMGFCQCHIPAPREGDVVLPPLELDQAAKDAVLFFFKLHSLVAKEEADPPPLTRHEEDE